MNNKIYFTNDIKNDKKEKIFSEIKKEHDAIGYFKLPEQNIDRILTFIDNFDENIEDIVVLGIGGSSLGSKAIYEFLKPVNESNRRLHFFESTDPINIMDSLKKINMQNAHFFVISKSGGTVETISIFKYIYASNNDSKHYTFITDEGSNLDKFAKSISSEVFYLPENVGGRFSVLSVVGLLPLGVCGIDIQALLDGAKGVKDNFFKKGHLFDTLMDKAFFYSKHHERYRNNCIFAYSETLEYFTQWYVQLWGESIGKHQKHSIFNVGLTPIGLIGPKDQHSFLQLIMEGARDKTVTFLKIKEFKHELLIPSISLPHLEALDSLNGIAFHELIGMQCDSVVEALRDEKTIPVDEISIPAVDELSIGELMYYYELLTSLVGILMDVDTYDQPGVEAGKIILKTKLEAYQH